MSKRSKLKARRDPQVKAQGGANLGYSFTSSSGIMPTSQDTNLRGWRPSLDADFWRMVPNGQHRAMLSDARYIFGGASMVSGAVLKKAQYVVGDAWVPRYVGRDDNFRRVAEPVMRRWARNCDVRGGPNDWRLNLRNASIAIDRDGDVFAVLTDVGGSPRIQWLEAHRIGNPSTFTDSVVPDAAGTQGYAGRYVSSGVIYDDYMRPVGYNLLSGARNSYGTETWRILDAANVVPFFDPVWFSQTRGVPSIVNGILDWYDIGEIKAAETIAVKAASSISLIETNETGRREYGKEALGSGAPMTGRQGLETRMIEKGLIRYIKAGNNVEAFQSNRPSPAWMGFMEDLKRGAFLGLGLPYEFVWDSAKIGGAGVRSMVGQVQRTVDDRQSVMFQPALTILLWAVARYMRRGDVPFAFDWFEWDFSMPARYSVDLGRDSQNERENLAVGTQTLSQVLGAQGISVADHLNERAADYRLAVSIAEETGTPLSFLLNMGAKAAPVAAPTVEPTDDTKTPDDSGDDSNDDDEDEATARRTRQ